MSLFQIYIYVHIHLNLQTHLPALRSIFMCFKWFAESPLQPPTIDDLQFSSGAQRGEVRLMTRNKPSSDSHWRSWHGRTIHSRLLDADSSQVLVTLNNSLTSTSSDMVDLPSNCINRYFWQNHIAVAKAAKGPCILWLSWRVDTTAEMEVMTTNTSQWGTSRASGHYTFPAMIQKSNNWHLVWLRWDPFEVRIDRNDPVNSTPICVGKHRVLLAWVFYVRPISTILL